VLRKLVLAALLVLGFAAAAPQGAQAAPMGPAMALPAQAAPGAVEQAQYYYRRRYWRPRPYYRPYYRRPYYVRPRPFYRPYYRPYRRFYY